MYTRILVPLDGSPFAEHALPAAVALSRLTGASLHLMLVHEARRANVPDATPDHLKRWRELDYLHATAARAIASGARSVDVALTEGWVPDAIERECARTNADLIVMTDRARMDHGTPGLGLVTSCVARHGQVPVLVMRCADRAADLAHGPRLQRVLVAADDAGPGAAVAECAVEFACAAAGGAGRGTPNRTDVEVGAGRHAVVAILDAASRTSVDVIAVPTREGTATLDASGTVADRVACGTPLPILICPTPMPDERAV